MRIEFGIQLLEGRDEFRMLFESGKGTNAILLKKWFLRRRLRFVAVTIENLLRLLNRPLKFAAPDRISDALIVSTFCAVAAAVGDG